MNSRWGGLLLLVASACLWTGGTTPLEIVSEQEITDFAHRIEQFYGALAERSLDTQSTFEDPVLRAFFLGEDEFADYYAAVADEVRKAGFRHGRPLRVEILEFRLEASDRAVVEVTLVGKHERSLRFWEIKIHRTDTWRRVGASWLVSPKRL